MPPRKLNNSEKENKNYGCKLWNEAMNPKQC